MLAKAKANRSESYAIRRVELKNPFSGASDLRDTADVRTFNLKVIPPLIDSWIKKSNEIVGVGIKP
jgi:hypothetical protein